VDLRGRLDVLEERKMLLQPGIEPRPFSLDPVAIPTVLYYKIYLFSVSVFMDHPISSKFNGHVYYV
jgi:hypothetical protein